MTETKTLPDSFETDRLVLRRPVMDDAPLIFDRYATDLDVVRFISWPAHQSVADTIAHLEQCEKEWAEGSNFVYMVEERDGQSGPIGAMNVRPSGSKAEFGYVFAREYWGRGYASEALQVLVDWALAQPKIWRATAVCDAENPASGRVMEKVGMTFEGILRRYSHSPNVTNEPRDFRIYAKVK